ncbi:MAG: prepilin-type N-terminal cleavage/methylation domain-containing protein [Pseudohongiellaceae bacterium]|jgi:prepilin-type N-terminal cleavage/methylation domain-containing protein
MKRQQNNRRSPGFTLIELLSTLAIIGVLASVALPFMAQYSIKARVTEGVTLLGELRRRVETEFYDTGNLATAIPAAPAADGQVFGGPFYNYATLFGQEHEMWDRIEYQIKGPHRVLALRAQRKPEWNNSDIGLHLQIRLNADGSISVRCTANLFNDELRTPYIPSSCQDGNSNEWSW